ncbi:APC family permease [Schleiferilactobacillus shenzhenensis]|uniref:YcaM n=1 Tax=Schleiferilactobacillus shenzhenensis LY-73 TaxID=1231336 RepID=U4TW70_9LACO|nr:APC family permease [Schleiferilactobacillus shenzhenensis]ERL66088.1 hypothetical protein L248_1180 [Schleiferilactobacillus shenzhenensis LY-73]
MPDTTETRPHYIPWVVVALMDFVTVIGFDDIIYNFRNQGLVAVTSWVLMTFLYVIPYSLIVAHLGSTFSADAGGITSWVRETNGDTLGYFAAWFYWITGLPYVVDVANSVVISFGWMVNGDGDIQSHMNNAWFGLLTAVVFIFFIWFQSRFQNKSLEIMSVIGGGAMFIMTVLFVGMTIVGLTQGSPIKTQPFNLQAFLPKKLDLSFFATFGLFIFAMNGSELAAPYTADMKHPSRDFPKSLKMIAVMTMFLTLFGTFSLGVYFNAHHLPNDLKMNGSYYAFQAIGKQFGLGNILMYVFAVVQCIYMLAQLAVILDASTRVFLGDMAKRFMPRQLSKTNAAGLPINGYWMTTILCGIIMVIAGFLPQINDIFNWLLNLNGIVSPFSTCFLFWAFMMVRRHSDRYPTPSYTYLKNDRVGFLVGLWMFAITFLFALMGFWPVDAAYGSALWTRSLVLYIVVTLGMVVLGFLMPWIAKRQRERDGLAFGAAFWYTVTGLLMVGGVYVFTIGIYNEIVPASFGVWRVVITVLVDLGVVALVWLGTRNGRRQVATAADD